MKDLHDKVAVITGAGSGIGRGTALALAEAGVHIVVADIDEQPAHAVADEVRALGTRAIAVRTDVTDRESLEELADRAWEEFGGVQILHNNAGVVLMQRIDATTEAEWHWIRSINLDGVMNGLHVFLPRLKAQQGEKHIVNTASTAGMTAELNLGAYSATKFAVVALSETLREELADDGIGVSVLCPGGVNTNIFPNALQRRPAGGAEMLMPRMELSYMRLMDPEDVGRLVRRAIGLNELYIFTHPELGGLVRARYERIFEAFELAEKRDAASPA